MSKKETYLTLLVAVVTAIWGILAIIADYIVPNLPFLSTLSSWQIWLIFVFLLGLTIIITLFIWTRRRIIHDRRFKHLTIHYSSRKDSPEVTDPDRPRFIINGNTRQAFWVSDLIEPYIRRHKIDWYTHDNLRALRIHFKNQHINENKRKPSPEELGLWIKPNGSLALIEPKLKPEMLERLNKCKLEGKLKDYEIAFLNPWYCWFLRFQFIDEQVYPPNRRIMANVSTKQAFGAPPESIDIINNELVSSNRYSPRPWEDISKWCKRKKGWTFNQRKITVEELAGCYQ